MQDCMNPVSDFGNVREAVCISTQKIMDACRDQDCMENIPVYLTQESQNTLDNATSVKARSAELLYADVEVEPVGYQEGYYCISIQYYYRVIADAVLCAVRPAAIYGLATFNKRAMLYGGEGCAVSFSSNGTCTGSASPTAVVSAIDPMILCARIEEVCQCAQRPSCGCGSIELPEAVAAAFDDELVFHGMNRRLLVTLGQFSLVRLERETQLQIPSYDFCMPSRTCCDAGCGCPENPCEAFNRLQFPVNSFFPTSGEATLCETGGCGCGSCGCSTAAPAGAGGCDGQETHEISGEHPVVNGGRRR